MNATTTILSVQPPPLTGNGPLATSIRNGRAATARRRWWGMWLVCLMGIVLAATDSAAANPPAPDDSLTCFSAIIFGGDGVAGDCTPPPGVRTVGGTVSGTHGTSKIRLKLAVFDIYTGWTRGSVINSFSNGPFTFSMGAFPLYGFNVSIEEQPASGTCTLSNASGAVPAANVTNVTATCTRHNYPVTITVSGGAGIVTPAEQSVLYGDEAVFEAVPDAGYEVGAVTGDRCTPARAADGSWRATIDAPCAIAVRFIESQLTVTTLGGGAGSCDGIICNSIRAAVALANTLPGETSIRFADGLGGTVALDATLRIDNAAAGSSLHIDGGAPADSTPRISLSGLWARRVLEVTAGSTAILENLTITDGRSNWGAGISNLGDLVLRNSQVFFNQSVVGGAAGIYNHGNLRLERSRVHTNFAATDSGGLSNWFGATLVLENSMVFGNNAGTQGGGLSNRGTLMLNHSTVDSNRAASGDGLYNVAGTASITASVLATHNGSQDCLAVGGTVDIRHSLVQDGSCGVVHGQQGNLVLTAGLVPDGSSGIWMPQSRSPLIDAVPCDVVTTPGFNGHFDFRGEVRPNGLLCDIGAVEVRQHVLEIIPSVGGRVNSGGTSDAFNGVPITECGLDYGRCIARYSAEGLRPGEPVWAELVPAADDGYVFDRWLPDECAGTSPELWLKMDQPRTCQAYFRRLEARITTVIVAGQGAADPPLQIVDLDATGEVSLHIVAAPGYSIGNVYNTYSHCGPIRTGIFEWIIPSVTNDCAVSVEFVSGYQTAVQGSGQSAVVNAAFAMPLRVFLIDSDAYPVPEPGVRVSFQVPESGPSAVLSADEVKTTADGEAQVLAVANDQVGSYQVIARLPDFPDIPPMVFTLENVPRPFDVLASIDNDTDYLGHGELAGYLVQVHNPGAQPATGLDVMVETSAALLDGDGDWVCLGPVDSGCTDGTGPLQEAGLVLAGGQTLQYWLSVPVDPDGDAPTVEATLTAIAGDRHHQASDTDLLVLLRDGFDTLVEPELPQVEDGPEGSAATMEAYGGHR